VLSRSHDNATGLGRDRARRSDGERVQDRRGREDERMKRTGFEYRPCVLNLTDAFATAADDPTLSRVHLVVHA